MILRPITPGDAGALAAVHALALDEPWPEAAFEALMPGPGVFGYAVTLPDALAGFCIARSVVDEAEILTLAVAPASRRQGVARAVLRSCIDTASLGGARSMFLEVAADNHGALGLYVQAGFIQVGRRPAYYATRSGPVDALILRLAI